MKPKTTQEVFAQYVNLLVRRREIEDKHRADMAKIDSAKDKMELWLTTEGDLVKDTSMIADMEPYIAWRIGDKTDSGAIDAYITIRDMLIPEIEKPIEDLVSKRKGQMREIENWALGELLTRKASNFSTKDIGRAQLEVVKKYTVVDKVQLARWAVDNNVESELSISFRQNSKFVASVVEETGELPPGTTSFSENKVKFVKA